LSTPVPEATVVVAETPDDAKREIAIADAAYGTLPATILLHAQRLRRVQSPQAAPPAGYYHPDLIAHPVIVTNLRWIFADRVPVPRQTQPPEGLVAESSAKAAVSELHAPDQLDRLLPIADFVILTMPHTPKTEGLFDAVRFGLMEKSAFFINVGRGMTTRLASSSRTRAGLRQASRSSTWWTRVSGTNEKRIGIGIASLKRAAELRSSATGFPFRRKSGPTC
jgi:hypothetical protein